MSEILNFMVFFVVSAAIVAIFSRSFYRLILFFKKVPSFSATYREALKSFIDLVLFTLTGIYISIYIFLDFIMKTIAPLDETELSTTQHNIEIFKYCLISFLSIYILSMIIYSILYFKNNNHKKINKNI